MLLLIVWVDAYFICVGHCLVPGVCRLQNRSLSSSCWLIRKIFLHITRASKTATSLLDLKESSQYLMCGMRWYRPSSFYKEALSDFKAVGALRAWFLLLRPECHWYFFKIYKNWGKIQTYRTVINNLIMFTMNGNKRLIFKRNAYSHIPCALLWCQRCPFNDSRR